MTTTDLHTAEQLLRMPSDGMRRELVRGELRTMAPAGSEHSRIESTLIRELGNFVHEHRLGWVYPGDAGFVLARDPDTVRVPDVAFVRRERLPADDRGLLEFAPDLVVEVVSPHDRADEVAEKVDLWLQAGTPLVWVVQPRRREVTVYAAGKRPVILTAEDALDGADVLPGFSVPISPLFER